MTNSADPDQLASSEDLHCLLRQGTTCLAREGRINIADDAYGTPIPLAQASDPYVLPARAVTTITEPGHSISYKTACVPTD